MKRVSILGSTGSIGRQALEVLSPSDGAMTLFGLCAKSDTEGLIRQANEYRPSLVACETPFDTSRLPRGTEVYIGENAAAWLAENGAHDVTVNGVSGFGALSPLLASLKRGQRVALANKESIVCGKPLIDAYRARYGGEIVPVDSEQSAIFQCLACGRRSEVESLVLTASGGPFWRLTREELAGVTPERALAHPTWRMGRKITIDSATLFNKGLEIIEAAYLFDLPAERIEAVIHPQSIVHSMVRFMDGTCMANLSKPDMRLPIQYALTYPERTNSPAKQLDLPLEAPLSFHRIDMERFVSVRLAYETLRAGRSYPIVYNGANEAAVEAFCGGALGFLDIERTVEYTLSKHVPTKPDSFSEILEIDRDARETAKRFIQTRAERQEDR